MNYTKLEDISRITGHQLGHLLRQGAAGKLSIYVVPHPSWRFHMRYVKSVTHSADVTDYHCLAGEVGGVLMVKLLLRVAPLYLESFINYPDSAEIDTFLPDGLADSDVALVSYQGDSPLLLKDCCLVVKNEDLLVLQGGKRQKKERVQSPVEEATVKATVEASAPDTPVPAKARRQKAEPSPYAALLTISEVSELVGLSQNTVRNYMKAGNFPVSITSGTRTVRWKRSEIEAWMDSRKQTSLHK